MVSNVDASLLFERKHQETNIYRNILHFIRAAFKRNKTWRKKPKIKYKRLQTKTKRELNISLPQKKEKRGLILI